MRMVSQARGNESVRRVMQESTVTIEEVEDEVVDLVGMFNNFARSSMRMVKEVRKRPFPPSQSRMKEGASEEDSEEGMPRKQQRESILYYAAQCARAQLQHRGYDVKEAKRRANVLRATWNQVNDQNDLVKEVLEFLKDYPERGFRKEFLKDLEFIYGEDDQDWKKTKLREKHSKSVRPLRRNQRREKKQADQKTRLEE